MVQIRCLYLLKYLNRLNAVSARYSQVSAQTPETSLTSEKEVTAIAVKDRVNSALKLYFEGVNVHKKLVNERRAEFELGKRHLANMMGLDPDNISQDDIDEAIRYLFPSGLMDKKAWPVMKPPDEIFPKIPEFDFDDEGKPTDLLFFTVYPRFYRILSEINDKSQSLIEEHDRIVLDIFKSGAKPRKVLENEDAVENHLQVLISSSRWMTMEEFCESLIENIKDDMYANLIIAFEHLLTLPGAYKHIEFFRKYRREISGAGVSGEPKLFFYKIPKVVVNEEGQRCAIAIARVKRTNVEVTVTDTPGGYTIDGHQVDIFQRMQSRELLYWPLILCDMLGKLDIKARVIDGPGGLTVVPRAIMTATALSISALYPEQREKLRLAGLMTFDPRKRERAKINQKGARARWIWLKR